MLSAGFGAWVERGCVDWWVVDWRDEWGPLVLYISRGGKTY